MVDVNGEALRYTVRYVSAVTQDGSGFTLPLRGGAFVQVKVMAPTDDQNYNPAYTPVNRDEAVIVVSFQTFRQVAYADTYEYATQVGLGVLAQLPFRVFTLGGPGNGSRLASAHTFAVIASFPASDSANEHKPIASAPGRSAG